MTLQEDMDSKRNWTQSEIDGLKSKYARTHFTHFSPSPVKLKRAPRKKIKGVWHIRVFGQWVPDPKTQRSANAGARAPEVNHAS